MMEKNLMQRIAGVMQDVAYLTKDDKVDTGKGKGYKAISEEKVTSTVRQAMIKHGIVMYPTNQVSSITNETIHSEYGDKINRLTHVDVIYHMVNVDDPSDFIEVASAGSGVDTQDKGIGKAMTYAYKYALLRAFAIPTGEDPDKVSSDVYTDSLYGSGAPKTDLSPDKLRETLVTIGGGDAERVKTFAEKCYNGAVKFEDMTVEQLSAIKVKLVNATKRA